MESNKKASSSIRKNVFKDGSSEPTPEQVTQIWIKLINQLEETLIISGEA